MSPKINLRVQHVTLSNSLIMSCSSSTVGFSPTDLWGFRQNSHEVNQNDDNDGFHDVISSHTRITMISLSEFPTWEETRAAWWRASPSCPPARWTSPWTGSPTYDQLNDSGGHGDDGDDGGHDGDVDDGADDVDGRFHFYSLWLHSSVPRISFRCLPWNKEGEKEGRWDIEILISD